MSGGSAGNAGGAGDAANAQGAGAKNAGSTSARPVIDLSMNEGPPPPRACFDVLARSGPGILRKYADATALEAAYAAYLGCDPANVLATTGGDDAIDRIFRAFLGPDQEMVFPTPTFEMIPACARMARGRLVPVEYEWGTLPHDEILAQVNERTGVVAVLTPDNPTGRAFTTRELLRLADALPPEVALLVDSAYAEFADEDHTAALLEVPRAVMVRTMSKSWALAGLRVGFAVGAKERIDVLRGFGGPYALAGPSMAIAIDRLQNGVAAMREFVAYVRSRRERLAEVIRRVGGRPQPSQTNFVFSAFPDARWIQRGMAAQGVLTRYFPHLPEYVRITVPRDDGEFRRVERALGCLAGAAGWLDGGSAGGVADARAAGTGPDAILFDMDGVLADVRRSYREAIVRTCTRFGIQATPDEIEAVKSAGGANDDWEATKRLLARADVRVSLEDVTRAFETIYQGTDEAPGLRRHETLIPSPGLLRALAGRHRLGIVTGRPRADAERFLREHELGDLFGAVVCREDAALKPDPAPVALAMRTLGVRTAWMLGDNPDDMRAAAGAGAVPVGIVPPGGGDSARAALDDAGAARVVDAEQMAELFPGQVFAGEAFTGTEAGE